MSRLPWFTTWGQVVQVVCALIGALLATLSFFGKLAPTTLPHWPPEVAWTGLGFSVGILLSLVVQALGRRRMLRASAASNNEEEAPLQIVDVYLENNDDLPQVTYKRKLRICIRNVTDEKLVIGPGTAWSRGADAIETQPRSDYVWQREGGKGWHSDGWAGPESNQIVVEPHEVVRTWIPLHTKAQEHEVRRRHELRTLGRLRVPIELSGRQIVQELSL